MLTIGAIVQLFRIALRCVTQTREVGVVNNAGDEFMTAVERRQTIVTCGSNGSKSAEKPGVNVAELCDPPLSCARDNV